MTNKKIFFYSLKCEIGPVCNIHRANIAKKTPQKTLKLKMITMYGLNKRGTTRFLNKLLFSTLRNVNGCLKLKKPVIRLKDEERVKT